MIMPHRKSSETATEIEEEHRLEITKLLFPQFDLTDHHQQLQNLSTNLEEHFSQNEYRDLLVNHLHRSHFSQSELVYQKFAEQKQLEIQVPKISHFYANQIFPDLHLLSKVREEPHKFQARHIKPIDAGIFKALDELFLEYGYIPNLERFLLFFPGYLSKSIEVEKELFSRCKMSIETTYFLGFCAAAEMGCPYMSNRMILKFLSVGGSQEWIKEGKFPEKMRRLLQLNRKLARCIWEVESEDFECLIEEGFWNQNEIALIIQIFSFVHSQCVITLGLGLLPQDRTGMIPIRNIEAFLQSYQKEETPDFKQTTKKPPLKEVLPLVKKLLEQLKSASSHEIVNPKKSFRKQRKSSEEEDNNTIEPYMKHIGNQLTDQTLVIQIMKVFEKTLPPFQPIPKRKDHRSGHFLCTDFNFELKAFPRLQNLFYVSTSIKKINTLLKESEEMALQNFGSELIGSTKQLRKAQRYYAQNLCGFHHPEYDYKKFMTNILTMPLKFYIRLLMLSPTHMKRQILNEINHEKGEVELFDMGHTAILIASAKLKLSLTLATYYMDY